MTRSPIELSWTAKKETKERDRPDRSERGYRIENMGGSKKVRNNRDREGKKNIIDI